MRALSAVLVVGACQVTPTESRPIPWLHGMHDLVASDQASASAAKRLAVHTTVNEDDCTTGAFSAVELVADIAPPPGPETILASYARGIAILDADGNLYASTVGYQCDGSLDEIDTLAVGTTDGEPTLVVVGNNGGRREYATWIGLFRLSDDRRLDATFTATVEDHRGDLVRKGQIHMLAGSLLYRPPVGKAELHVYDPVARAYLKPGEQVVPEDHDGPTVSRR